MHASISGGARYLHAKVPKLSRVIHNIRAMCMRYRLLELHDDLVKVDNERNYDI
jgi:hypothetical protein